MRTKRLISIIALILAMICLILPMTASATSADDEEVYDTHEFDGKTLGLMTGSAFVDWYDQYINITDPENDIHYYDTISDLATAVAKGDVDVSLGDLAPYQYAAARIDNVVAKKCNKTGDKLACIAPKNEAGEKLVAQFNEFLAELTESGELEKLQEKWCEGSDEELTIMDYTKLPATNGTLHVATDARFAPFTFMKDGQIVGYEIELVALFCEKQGYALNLEQVNFSAILSGIGADVPKYDFAASCFSITEERAKTMLFTDCTYVSYAGVMFRDDEAESGFSFDDLKESFNRTFVDEGRWKQFVSGADTTLEITVLSVIFGSIIGFVINLICRGGNKVANAISKFCRWLVKGMPEVVFLMILFYIVFGSSSISGLWTAIIGFTIIFACAIHEMLMSSEAAVDGGQAVAAKALGYSDISAYFHIILPQALTYFWPAFLTQLTAHIKATAIVGYVAVVDITKVGDLIRGSTYEPFFPLIAVAIVYFILAGFLRVIAKALAKRTDPHRRSEETIMRGIDVK